MCILLLLCFSIHKAVFHHVVGYRSPNPGAQLGFSFHASLPEERLRYLAAEVRHSGQGSGLAQTVKVLHPQVYELAIQQN